MELEFGDFFFEERVYVKPESVPGEKPLGPTTTKKNRSSTRMHVFITEICSGGFGDAKDYESSRIRSLNPFNQFRIHNNLHT